MRGLFEALTHSHAWGTGSGYDDAGYYGAPEEWFGFNDLAVFRSEPVYDTYDADEIAHAQAFCGQSGIRAMYGCPLGVLEMERRKHRRRDEG